jgi:hypothetical protein
MARPNNIDVKSSQESSNESKAREANSLATAMDQANKILGEYTDLPFYSPDPKQNICNAINKLPT